MLSYRGSNKKNNSIARCVHNKKNYWLSVRFDLAEGECSERGFVGLNE